ncbi:tripartite tricarboxylate transporter substrate-binding protein, partial [Acinetobacter baumannii]
MPVASVARVAVFLVAKPTLPVNTTQELISYLKANPGKLSYG